MLNGFRCCRGKMIEIWVALVMVIGSFYWFWIVQWFSEGCSTHNDAPCWCYYGVRSNCCRCTLGFIFVQFDRVLHAIICNKAIEWILFGCGMVKVRQLCRFGSLAKATLQADEKNAFPCFARTVKRTNPSSFLLQTATHHNAHSWAKCADSTTQHSVLALHISI